MTSSRQSRNDLKDTISLILKDILLPGNAELLGRATSLDDTDRYIAACQSILDTVAVRLRLYQRRHNTLVSIHSLPTEIFSQIIKEHASALDGKGYYQKLFALRLVSTEWKSAVDLSSTLWTSVFLSNEPYYAPPPIRAFLQLILKQSWTAPLDIAVLWGELHLLKPSIREVTRHAWRWRSLDVSIESANDFKLFTSFPTPGLEVLFIQSPERVLLDEPLFMGVLPRLKKLDLTSIVPPTWDAPYLRTLQYLSIANIQTPGPELRDFETLLKCSSVLEELQLINIHFFPPSVVSSRPTDDAPLASALRTAKLWNVSAVALAWFMEHVDVANVRHVVLETRTDDDLSSLLLLAQTTGPWINSLPPDQKSTQIRCNVRKHVVSFALGDLFRVKIASTLHLTQEADLEEICRLVGSKLQDYHINLDVQHPRRDSLLRLWGGLEGCFTHVTSLSIQEFYWQSGLYVDPAFIKVLGERDGARWRYPQVTSLSLALGGPAKQSLDDLHRLFQHRWSAGNQVETENAAQLSHLMIAGIDVSDGELDGLRASLPGLVISVGLDRPRIRWFQA